MISVMFLFSFMAGDLWSYISNCHDLQFAFIPIMELIGTSMAY